MHGDVCTIPVYFIGFGQEYCVRGNKIVPQPQQQPEYAGGYLQEKSVSQSGYNTVTGLLLESVYEGSLNPGKNLFLINTGNLSSGVYFTRVISGDGTKVIRTIVE